MGLDSIPWFINLMMKAIDLWAPFVLILELSNGQNSILLINSGHLFKMLPWISIVCLERFSSLFQGRL